MRRFLIDASCVTEGRIIVRDTRELHHMKHALRLKEGAEVLLSDGSGKEYFSRLVRYDDAAAVFETLYERAATADPETKITLFQCLPKQGKMEQIIQKATELGVFRIIPVLSERSVPRPQNMDARVSRWRRIAEEASKQSGRGRVPEVADGIGIAEAPAAAGGGILLFPYEGERKTSIKNVLRSLDKDAQAEIALIIGPEGGFSEREAAALIQAGARACSLGRTVLRTETAGPAAIAMIVYELELDRARPETE